MLRSFDIFSQLNFQTNVGQSGEFVFGSNWGLKDQRSSFTTLKTYFAYQNLVDFALCSVSDVSTTCFCQP